MNYQCNCKIHWDKFNYLSKIKVHVSFAVAEATSLKPALDTFSSFVKSLSSTNYAIKRDDAGKLLLLALPIMLVISLDRSLEF